MITLKFPNATLEVDKGVLLKVPIFKAFNNFTNSDVMEVEDISYEECVRILGAYNGTYFNDEAELFDYAGVDNIRDILRSIPPPTGKLNYMMVIYEYETYSDMIKSKGSTVQCLLVENKRFYFDSKLNLLGENKCKKNLVYCLLHNYIGYTIGSIVCGKNIDTVAKDVEEALKSYDVKNLAAIIDKINDGWYNCTPQLIKWKDFGTIDFILRNDWCDKIVFDEKIYHYFGSN